MKGANRPLKLLAGVILIMSALVPVLALDVPPLGGRVNDLAGIVSPETESALTAKLAEHENASSNQIVVLTIPSLDGEILEEYSIKVAEAWKIGQKGKDNGVILLVARDDRKIRIEVGYGLEGDLTDAVCSRIIRNEMVPLFRSGDFDAGVKKGVESILGVIAGSYTPAESSDEESSDGVPIGMRIIFGIMFTLVVGLFTAIGVFIKDRMGWFLYLFLIPFWAAFPAVIIGYPGFLFALGSYLVGFPILRTILSRTDIGSNFADKFGSSSSSSSSYSSSSGYSSSSDSSSSSSSSSFSGGGGSFGGGGSSGSW